MSLVLAVYKHLPARPQTPKIVAKAHSEVPAAVNSSVEQETHPVYYCQVSLVVVLHSNSHQRKLYVSDNYSIALYNRSMRIRVGFRENVTSTQRDPGAHKMLQLLYRHLKRIQTICNPLEGLFEYIICMNGSCRTNSSCCSALPAVFKHPKSGRTILSAIYLFGNASSFSVSHTSVHEQSLDKTHVTDALRRNRRWAFHTSQQRNQNQ